MNSCKKNSINSCVERYTATGDFIGCPIVEKYTKVGMNIQQAPGGGFTSKVTVPTGVIAFTPPPPPPPPPGKAPPPPPQPKEVTAGQNQSVHSTSTVSAPPVSVPAPPQPEPEEVTGGQTQSAPPPTQQVTFEHKKGKYCKEYGLYKTKKNGERVKNHGVFLPQKDTNGKTIRYTKRDCQQKCLNNDECYFYSMGNEKMSEGNKKFENQWKKRCALYTNQCTDWSDNNDDWWPKEFKYYESNREKKDK